MSLDPHHYYNAINIFCQGDYFKIKNISEGLSWSDTWQKIISGQKTNIDPEKEWIKLEKLGIKLILQNDADYSPLLKEISHPPMGMYFKGDIKFYQQSTVAIVGTRKATPQGRKLAEDLASQLSRQNIVVISGLALGIDESAHWGAIRVPMKTVAVLAGGLEEIYPRQNENLANKIVQTGGTIISEYAIGSPTFPTRFLERNRIISGLSKAVVVIEAPFRSGALATAKFAVEQNRDVYAVPGPIYHKNFLGTNNLIKKGAYLLTEVDDLIGSFPELEEKVSGRKNIVLPILVDESEKIIFQALNDAGEPLNIDKIIELTKLTAPETNRTLTTLIMNNLVKERSGRYFV